MNKKLITLAAALAAPLAVQASVEVYGNARLSFDYVNNNDNRPASANPCGANLACKDSSLSLISNYSYIGFKGDEDLGAGLTALWQIEQDVAFDSRKWGSVARDTYAGLGTGFGSVLAGHMQTPYRAATERLDPFANTRADFNAVIGSFDGQEIFNDQNRTSNTLAYISPDFSGLKAAVAYILSDAVTGNDTLPLTSVQSDQGAYSISFDYDNGPIFATAAYESLLKAGLDALLTSTPSTHDATAWKVGGSYTIRESATLGVVYENIDLGGAVGDRIAWSLDASYRLGATTLMAAYNGADKTKLGNTGANQYSIGVKQGLSKYTEVYVLYTQLSNDGAASYGLDNYNTGVIDGVPSSNAVVKGRDMSAVSIGINHAFSSK